MDAGATGTTRRRPPRWSRRWTTTSTRRGRSRPLFDAVREVNRALDAGDKAEAGAAGPSSAPSAPRSAFFARGQLNFSSRLQRAGAGKSGHRARGDRGPDRRAGAGPQGVRTSRVRTRSARSSPTAASCSRTARAARPGRQKAEPRKGAILQGHLAKGRGVLRRSWSKEVPSRPFSRTHRGIEVDDESPADGHARGVRRGIRSRACKKSEEKAGAPAAAPAEKAPAAKPAESAPAAPAEKPAAASAHAAKPATPPRRRNAGAAACAGSGAGAARTRARQSSDLKNAHEPAAASAELTNRPPPSSDHRTDRRTFLRQSRALLRPASVSARSSSTTPSSSCCAGLRPSPAILGRHGQARRCRATVRSAARAGRCPTSPSAAVRSATPTSCVSRSTAASTTSTPRPTTRMPSRSRWSARRIKGRRDKVFVASKFCTPAGPSRRGLDGSRHHRGRRRQA